MDKFEKDEVEKDIFKKLKKYIAGFRSGNPKNEKNAKTYYILTIAFWAIGSSWQISDFAVLLLLLIAPSVFYNFKSMRLGEKGYGRIFAITLALFVATTLVFKATYVEDDLTVKAKTPSGSTIMKGKDYKSVVETFEEKGFTNIKLEKIEDLITGWLTKDGEVEDVSVGGDVEYSPDKLVKSDTEVIIRYHTFPESEEDNTAKEDVKEETPTKEESVQEEAKEETPVKEEPTQEEVKEPEIYTVDNNEDLKEVLKVDSGEVVENFADKYKGKTIRFDGNIIHVMNHGNYKTRYDFLVRVGDYKIDEITRCPNFIFEDKNYFDLGLIGENIPKEVTMGQNYTITAKILEYDKTHELFFLEPISLEFK